MSWLIDWSGSQMLSTFLFVQGLTVMTRESLLAVFCIVTAVHTLPSQYRSTEPEVQKVSRLNIEAVPFLLGILVCIRIDFSSDISEKPGKIRSNRSLHLKAEHIKG